MIFVVACSNSNSVSDRLSVLCTERTVIRPSTDVVRQGTLSTYTNKDCHDDENGSNCRTAPNHRVPLRDLGPRNVPNGAKVSTLPGACQQSWWVMSFPAPPVWQSYPPTPFPSNHQLLALPFACQSLGVYSYYYYREFRS